MALKINRYQIFCNLSPLPAGEGIMVLKSTVIRFFAICLLSRGRGLGRGQNLRMHRIVFLMTNRPVSNLCCEIQQILKP